MRAICLFTLGWEKKRIMKLLLLFYLIFVSTRHKPFFFLFFDLFQLFYI